MAILEDWLHDKFMRFVEDVDLLAQLSEDGVYDLEVTLKSILLNWKI